MQLQPTYSPQEIKTLCIELALDYGTFKILTDVIEEDLHLYSEEELITLCEASMIMFSRCLLMAGMKYLK